MLSTSISCSSRAWCTCTLFKVCLSSPLSLCFRLANLLYSFPLPKSLFKWLILVLNLPILPLLAPVVRTVVWSHCMAALETVPEIGGGFSDVLQYSNCICSAQSPWVGDHRSSANDTMAADSTRNWMPSGSACSKVRIMVGIRCYSRRDGDDDEVKPLPKHPARY